MRQGLYTSGILHSFVGLLLITNFHFLENKSDELSSNVSVKILSEQELIKLSKMETMNSLEAMNFKPEKQVDLDSYQKKPEISLNKNIGNEIKGVSEPDAIKITKRKTKDEIITRLAQRGDSEVGKPFKKKENKFVEDIEVVEKANNDNSKQENSSSQISSEGKNVKIVSGALKIAKIPSSKPSVFDKVDKSKVNKTVLKSDEDDIYSDLIAQVVKSKKDEEVIETSIQKLAKARILKTLNDNWNVVSINRLPNYEKYVIILELKIDNSGNISGPIRMVYPEKASGNFLIAKRSAIKAVLESSPFPVPKESFPRGLVLRVVFDPETNVGVNNG
ncbi:TonB C-terminal domain-containing protein [Paracoccaceae bacterium]|nr:TonB C-terminal domain-containing protein [Paracoccaceae bacterium]